MFDHNLISGTKIMLLAGALASGIFASPGKAQSPVAGGNPSAAVASPRYRPSRFSKRAEMYYTGVWGVDSLSVKLMESGELIRFTYRVLDTDKARALNDEKLEPSLEDPRAGVSLVVPAVPFAGKLRQTSTPHEGRSYWVSFSNKGRRVKRGDHVSVVIGQFRADGLVVD